MSRQPTAWATRPRVPGRPGPAPRGRRSALGGSLRAATFVRPRYVAAAPAELDAASRRTASPTAAGLGRRHIARHRGTGRRGHPTGSERPSGTTRPVPVVRPASARHRGHRGRVPRRGSRQTPDRPTSIDTPSVLDSPRRITELIGAADFIGRGCGHDAVPAGDGVGELAGDGGLASRPTDRPRRRSSRTRQVADPRPRLGVAERGPDDQTTPPNPSTSTSPSRSGQTSDPTSDGASRSVWYENTPR
jgi:hypothetical protein